MKIVAALLVGLSLAVPAFSNPAKADAVLVSHGLSSFGDLKYPKGFAHFDYVNPHAPKGGSLRTMGTTAQNSFDSLNPFILKGVAANGLLASGDEPGLLFDSLMVPAGDEADAIYGLVAQWAEYPASREWVIFQMRPQARFHDGSAMTAQDVVRSFELLTTKGHPYFRMALRDVSGAKALGPHRVKFTFKGNNKRDLMLRVGALPILSAAYYETQPFDETTPHAPLGSGPYRVAEVDLGRSITFERVQDYWAKDLPVNVGRFNFDRIRFDYYRDRAIAFEAFKAGEYDLREEFTSKTWATEYNFPAMQEGRAYKLVMNDARPSGVQGFFINTRLPKFQNARVRHALDLAFDYEWTNKTLFFGAYDRTDSIFENANLEALQGPPTGAVKALLERAPHPLPAGVLTGRYQSPRTDGSGWSRSNLERANDLLNQAGALIIDGVRHAPNGEPLTVEFLMFEPGFKRIIMPYIKRLDRLGIKARIRMVDTAQFINRREQFDYDIMVARFSVNTTPGPELKDMWSSSAANIPGSDNLSGVADPLVDWLLDKVEQARTRDDLITATRALDRVVMAGHYWVPHWYKGAHTIAAYDKFERPAIKPLYQRAIFDTWWAKQIEKDKAE